MKGAGERDDAASSRVPPGYFYRIFNSFCTSVYEECLLWRRARCGSIQALCQFYIDIIRRNLKAGVAEPLQLLLDGLDDPRVIVPGAHHGDPGTQVDVAIALDIPDFGIPGFIRKYAGLNTDAPRNLVLADVEQFFIRCHRFSPKPLGSGLQAAI